jgi:MFS family permease
MSTLSAKNAVVFCMALFMVQPIQFGVWLSRIAEVQTELGLSKSALAFALLGMPVGLLPMLYFAGAIIDRIGVRLAFFGAFPVMLMTGVFPALASSVSDLFVGLILLGMSFAFAEVGLNVMAAQLEKSYQISIMNRAHGFWSLGIMFGSLGGVQMATLNISVLHALAITGVTLFPILLIISWYVPKQMIPKQAPAKKYEPWRIPSGLFPIIVFVFGATLAEGAMHDWATVYMREAPWGGSYYDGLAVSVYAGMITFGRFVGDTLNLRLGPVALARICISFAILGVLSLVLSGSIWMSLIGFGLVGLGVSVVFPLGVSATAHLSERHQARNVSVMTFGALTGFLIGPPLIGLIAELMSLRIGISILIPGLIISLFMSKHLLRW